MRLDLALAVMVFAPLVCAQPARLNVFDRLKDKASEVVDMDLPKDVLGLGASFLSQDKDVNAAKIKKLAEGLSNIVVKSLEFPKEGVYSNADVQQLIAELATPGWKQIINTTENQGKDTSRVWIKSTGNGELGGIRVMSAEARELTVVELIGRLRIEDLKDLGSLGIPKLNISSEHTGQPPKKNED